MNWSMAATVSLVAAAFWEPILLMATSSLLSTAQG